jgi:hypothetical protein
MMRLSVNDPGILLEDTDFVCSKEAAQCVVTRLMKDAETKPGGDDRFYVFSAEKRGVRVTLLPRTKV